MLTLVRTLTLRVRVANPDYAKVAKYELRSRLFASALLPPKAERSCTGICFPSLTRFRSSRNVKHEKGVPLYRLSPTEQCSLKQGSEVCVPKHVCFPAIHRGNEIQNSAL